MDSQYAAVFLNILLLHLWETDVRSNEDKRVVGGAGRGVGKGAKEKVKKGRKSVPCRKTFVFKHISDYFL